MNALVCRDLSVSYGGRCALRGVSLELPQGSFLSVTGPNGSGKSTFIKALLGLVKPSSGWVRICGGIKRKEIGYVPQRSGTAGDFPATVYEAVISGRLARLGMRPFYGRQDRQETEKNLRLMGLWYMRARAFRELSGGQRQRTLLARALCAAESMLVLDEPAAGLDAETEKQMYSLLKDINERRNITVVMVTHDLLKGTAAASHILELDVIQKYFGKAALWPGSAEGDHKDA